ncbi:hypothetical protein SASPL_132144 [Salvia splendens]|uniref:CHCH domain-containing protein n=1 Tax=Salvia splendens TaxID=180675 RepID=A0A8X8ZKY2_SALSN|nr:hypothetical protein SASPL_132144 [Salvia splendens]
MIFRHVSDTRKTRMHTISPSRLPNLYSGGVLLLAHKHHKFLFLRQFREKNLRKMPRRSSGVRQAPPPAPVQSGHGGSMLGGIGSTIAQGAAFGTGSAVAHRAVDAVMGPRTIQHEAVVSEAIAPSTAPDMRASDACNVQFKAFQDCLNNSGSEISKCQFYMDMLADCRRSSGSMVSS